jgi:pimeloyl-ACP methyl ester carboxylesterase
MRRSPYVRARAACVIVLCVLSAAGCGDSPDRPSPDELRGNIDRFEVDGQPSVLITPQPATGRVVLYTHGSGETVETIFRDPAKQPLWRALLRAGYALAATDAHGDNWGNPASERDTVALARELRGRGLRDVYVIALSMGGFNGLQLLEHDPAIKAWAGIFPACDLRAVYRVGLYPGQIRRAYGLGAKQPVDDALRGRSPTAVAPAPGLPMRFWASPDDRVIPRHSNTDACAALARRAGARVQVTTTRGDHGDPSNYDPEGVVELFDSAP